MHPDRRSGTHLFSASVVLSVLFGSLLWPGAARGTSFEELRTRYFLDRSVDYARELLLKEEYLSVLYQCTAQEIKVRREEGLDPALLNGPFQDLQPAYLDRNDPELTSAPMDKRYRLWVEYEEREYQRRLQIILSIRTALIEQGAPEQKQRMFRRELESALFHYGRQDWEMADLLFDRLLNDYDFADIDDILYYRGEASIQLQQYDAALAFLFQLLSKCPDSNFRAESYDRASDILLRLAKDRDLVKLYENYAAEGYPGDPADMGGVHVRAAQAEIGLGHYSNATEILQRVDAKSPFYLASRYYLADCLSALEQWPQAVDVLTEMSDMKQGKMPYDRWRMLVDEARIKLAFIFYEWEDYDRAAELFGQIGDNSPFYDRVLMGKAWIAYQLDDYERSIENTEELLRLYPLSSEIYEAGSLAGYCYEQMDEKSTALAHFFEVIEAGVGRNKLQTFLKERRRISEALAQLQAIEEDVFASGDEKAFEDYKRARNLLELCVKRIGLAELLQANSQMQTLVAERVLLDKLVKEHAALEATVVSSDDVAVMAEFVALSDRIYDIMDHLKTVGLERLKSTPLYYREARIGYINSMADTLSANLEKEITSLTSSVRQTEERLQVALESNQPEKCIDLGLRLDQLQEVLDDAYVNHVLSEDSRRPVLQTRVDRWSDFSFDRYAMGGMEFDELDRKYERLQQVENYINVLDEMIDQGESPTLPTKPNGSSEDDTLEQSENKPE